MTTKIILSNTKKNKEAKIMNVNIETDSYGFRVFDRKKIKEKNTHDWRLNDIWV